MGSFITNIHVRIADPAAVIKGLRQAKALPAVISPASQGWVSVFPQATESQEQKVLVDLTTAVAKQTKAPVISFLVHDSDILRYVLRDGDVLDEYDSDPAYFDDEDRPPSGGNASLLKRYCVARTSEKELSRVLHKKEVDGEEVVFAEDMLYWIGEKLGINRDFLPHSWDYLKSELPKDFTRITK